MKGPALWLKHYLRARQALSAGEWLVLLTVAARHGGWIARAEIARTRFPTCSGPASCMVRDELARLAQGGLIDLRPAAVSGGHASCEARITAKGMSFLGYPELAETIQCTNP